MTSITDNLISVERRIAVAAEHYGRAPEAIRLVAVSKQQPSAAIAAAADAGQRDFGENYLQEALPKMAASARPGIRWHFIGAIQSNKTRAIAEDFDWVHTVDRAKIAHRLGAQRPYHAEALQVCLQVSLAEEPGKTAGVAPAELARLAEQVASLSRLRLRGLMCIPPPVDEFERQRHYFRQLRECLETLNRQGYELDTLSMGMSADLEAAIAEGATIVRVGTAIFGARGQA